MARKTVKPIDLSKAIEEALSRYGTDVYNVLKDAVKEVSDDATEKLQNVSSFAPDGHPSGAYSQSWSNEEIPTGRLTTKRIVHNIDHYRLSHLLEKGHVSRNGTGRTYGRVPAYPHIAPVNDWANEELPRVVERMIKSL